MVEQGKAARYDAEIFEAEGQSVYSLRAALVIEPGVVGVDLHLSSVDEYILVDAPQKIVQLVSHGDKSEKSDYIDGTPRPYSLKWDRCS